jgi:NADH-quinone oxidoreductase subunit E
MAPKKAFSPLDTTLKKWKNKRGALIMALHEIQNQRGYVPREAAFKIAEHMNVSLARIYEVLTFYNYFKLESPGRAVISVCTGTACHLKGAPALIEKFETQLGISTGQTTPDNRFHLQSVRCVGCCGLAPVVVINEKTYGKCDPSAVAHIIHEWNSLFDKEDEANADQ